MKILDKILKGLTKAYDADDGDIVLIKAVRLDIRAEALDGLLEAELGNVLVLLDEYETSKDKELLLDCISELEIFNSDY